MKIQGPKHPIVELFLTTVTYLYAQESQQLIYSYYHYNIQYQQNGRKQIHNT